MTNPHQSCQTCKQWEPPGENAKPPMLGFCFKLTAFRNHSSGTECDYYDPLDDGEEVIRRGQAIMEAERGESGIHQPPHEVPSDAADLRDRELG